MDEPTSGLDAHAALALLKTFADVAQAQRRNVVAVVHQPSFAALSTCRRVVVLGVQGRVAFAGRPAQLGPYLADHGAPCPAGANPADFALARLAADGSRAWARAWAADGDEPAPAPLPSKRGDGTARLCVPAYAASFVEQYKVLLLRSLHCYVADPSQGPTSLALTAFSVAFLALQLFGAPPSVAKANGILFFALVLYQAATLPLVVVMPLERAATVREYRNGVFGSGAYWLARVTTAALSALVLAALSMAIFYPSLALPSAPDARGRSRGSRRRSSGSSSSWSWA
ncbi:ATPase [Aureococcus anophagefferens]|nr:ATPase [Aureococcus anophagefferens]